MSELEYVVGIRFSNVGKIYHFAPGIIKDVKIGDRVVVETSRGRQLGVIACLIDRSELSDSSAGWKEIDRIATPADLMQRQVLEEKEETVLEFCRQRVLDLKINGLKIVQAEYSFDGKRLSIMFSNESEEKLDMRQFKKDVARKYSDSEVDFRQLGPRDVSKIVDGLGACGLEKRCCCSFITEFKSISIRMAKDQGISLTPTEITGMCGRLRCCLFYEQDQYKEALKKLPRKNKRVTTNLGVGKVIEIRALKGEFVVTIPEVGKRLVQQEDYNPETKEVVIDEKSRRVH